MYVHSLTIICFYTLLYLESTSCNIEHIKKYDVVNIKVREFRNKSTEHLNISGKEIDLEIEFASESFKKNFHLFLSEDKLFKEIPVESYVFSSNFSQNNNNLRAKFYEGYLKDNAIDSSVFGCMVDNIFTGKITHENVTYFIEPAHIFFDDTNLNSKKTIVYRDIDIYPFQWKIFPHSSGNFPQWEVPYRVPNASANTRMENSGLEISNSTEDIFCEIEIVVDHTLYNFYKNDTQKLSAVLYFHAKFADYVFRKADFNMDGNPDNIRIVVGNIHIYKSEKDYNYPMLHASSISDYLTLFGSRRQNSSFCLSIAMSYRKFDTLAVGIAFRAMTGIYGAIGGICDQPLSSYRGTDFLYFNTGVINMHYKEGKPHLLAITMLAFTHEIGHAFGSDHDPVSHSVCSPGKFDNYLMYPTSSYGSHNAMKFSPCSRKDIWEVLVAKGGCLKYNYSICGNAVREGDEECDCGPEMFCKFVDPCCTPSDAKPPEKGCTIRSKKGSTCSPKESECCNNNCSILEDKKTLCYRDEVQCLFSFCDGKSAVCPTPQNKTELCTPKFSCDKTTCSNITLCSSQGWQDCICKGNLSTQCLQCCKTVNDCVPASELGLENSDGKPYILISGASCNHGKYMCDDSGNCIPNVYLAHTSTELYIIMIIIPLLISAVLLTALFLSFLKDADTENNILTMSDN